MISSLGLLSIGRQLLSATRAPVVALLHAALPGFATTKPHSYHTIRRYMTSLTQGGSRVNGECFDARRFSFSVCELNPGKAEGRQTCISTGFSTFGRISGRPKDSERGVRRAVLSGQKGRRRGKASE